MKTVNNFWNILSGIDGGRILDVACGRGQFVRILVDNLGAFSYITGLDVDREALKQASDEFQTGNILFLYGTSRQIGFPDASFDTVSMSKGLHHLEDPRLGLFEMKRVVNNGGLMIINEMYSDDLSLSQMSHMNHHHLRADIDRLQGITHNYTFTRDQILEMVEDLGLHDIAVYDYTEDTGPADSPELIGEYLAKMDTWTREVKGMPEEKQLLAAMEALKEQFYEHGISRPPQVVILGHK